MVLNRLLLDLATRRPRTYVVEAPGGAPVRAALEAELDRRGWITADSAASADALLVAGALPESLLPAADLLWSQLPGPRARATVTRKADASEALDGLRADLRDAGHQRADAAARPLDEVSPWLPDEDHGHDHDHDDDHDDDHGHDHGSHDHGSHDHGSHDHGAMAPGGIPLAEGDDDRDGLEMDVLVHPLGPLLDRWPGGLELRMVLHGDVVGDLEVRWHPADPAEQDEAAKPAWAAYDAVATTLALSGDAVGARLARRLRDADPGADHAQGAARLARRVERWRRWSMLPPAAATALTRLLHAATGIGTASDAPLTLDAAGLADLLRGRDLGDVRLLVAAHAPRLRVAPTEGVHRG